MLRSSSSAQEHHSPASPKTCHPKQLFVSLLNLNYHLLQIKQRNTTIDFETSVFSRETRYIRKTKCPKTTTVPNQKLKFKHEKVLNSVNETSENRLDFISQVMFL